MYVRICFDVCLLCDCDMKLLPSALNEQLMLQDPVNVGHFVNMHVATHLYALTGCLCHTDHVQMTNAATVTHDSTFDCIESTVRYQLVIIKIDEYLKNKLLTKIGIFL